MTWNGEGGKGGEKEEKGGACLVSPAIGKEEAKVRIG